MNARRVTLTTLVTCCVLIGGLLLSGAPASAELTHFYTGHSFGPEGSGGGTFPGEVTPASVAIEQSTGDVYALAPGGRIYKFNAAGEPADFSALGTNEIATALEVEAHIAQIAVSSAGATAGDIYVATAYSSSVEIYGPEGSHIGELTRASVREPCGVAVAPSGHVYVATYTGEVDEYTPVANPATSSDYTASLWGAGEICSIAGDSEGNLYAAALGSGPVTRYEASQFNTLEIPGIGTQITEGGGASLAIDPAPSHDDLYVDQRTGVAQFDSTGKLLGTSAAAGPGALNSSSGLAVNDASGEVYADDSGVVEIFGPALAAAEVTTGAISGLQPTSATLEGTVDPANVPVSACEFEYGTDSSYGTSVPCSQTVPFSGEAQVPVSVGLTGLQPNTTYHYRLFATDANGTNDGVDATFTTSGPARVESESSSSFTQTGATLEGQIDPDGYATSYRFEYGQTPSYGTSTPVPDGSLGSAEEPTVVPAAELTGLKVGTTYHYRLVATSSQGTVDGPDHEFTTVAAALIESGSATDVAATSATLRAYIQTLGNTTHYYFQYGTSSCSTAGSSCADIPLAPGGLVASAEESVSVHLQNLSVDTTYRFRTVTTNILGTTYGSEHTFTTQKLGGTLVLPDGRQWELVSPTIKHGADIRSAFGKVSLSDAPFQAAADGHAVTYGTELPLEGDASSNEAFDLSQVLSSRGPDGWSSAGIEAPITTPSGPALDSGAQYRLLSSDLSLGLVQPRDETRLSPLATERTLYLRTTATTEYLALVTPQNVLTGSRFGAEGETGGASYENRLHFVDASPDLKHVVIDSIEALTTNAASGRASNMHSLYEWSAGQLKLVSILPNGKPANTEGHYAYLGAGAQFGDDLRLSHAIANDGSRVIWTTSQSPESHLYLWDSARDESIAVDTAQGTVEPGVEEAVYQTASSDDKRIFFADGQKLTADAVAGDRNERNLYVFEVTSAEGAPLAGRLTDLTPGYTVGDEEGIVGASEDGAYVYYLGGGRGFYLRHYGSTGWEPAVQIQANPSLRGIYTEGGDGDTLRVSANGQYVAFNDGEGEGQVELYDAADNRIVCAACSATGEEGQSTVPPARNDDGFGEVLYESRALSNSGRLFFESAQALVPQATQGVSNVYEYEPVGVSGCGRGSETFVEPSEGCVGLISGRGGEFLDASESGDDVFFVTGERLVPEDHDSAIDVYDAHVCSAAVPCRTATVSPSACSTPDSCRAAPAPQPQIFGPSGSSTFSGAGNLTKSASAPAVKVKTKAKPLTVAQKLTKALKACRKKQSRKARAKCEAQARKKTAVSRSRKSAKKGKK
jgi:hypothetical protein